MALPLKFHAEKKRKEKSKIQLKLKNLSKNLAGKEITIKRFH